MTELAVQPNVAIPSPSQVDDVSGAMKEMMLSNGQEFEDLKLPLSVCGGEWKLQIFKFLAIRQHHFLHRPRDIVYLGRRRDCDIRLNCQFCHFENLML